MENIFTKNFKNNSSKKKTINTDGMLMLINSVSIPEREKCCSNIHSGNSLMENIFKNLFFTFPQNKNQRKVLLCPETKD